ncbi:MAG: cupin-like domain-containing protein [Gammaproteobacteria bacterium]|nr:cupin-like domain-containing protein [Gammaproteobacteria bacterium]
MYQQIENLNIQCVNSSESGTQPFTPPNLLHFTHDILNTGLFEDEALIRLLDQYPAQDIHVTTMVANSNPGQDVNNWRVGTTEGVSGEQILEAVRKGRLWLNIKRLAENAPAYQALMSTLYQALSTKLSCSVPTWQRATLLVSSPTTSVYYHADSIPNLLWHIRGNKTVFVYPHSNYTFASQQQLELICSGKSEERLKYQPEFESSAQQIHLKPGQALLWPQHSPHRVVNTSGLNVSLSTEHITPAARHKVNLFRANRLLRKLGIHPIINPPNSLSAQTKQGIAICHNIAKKLLQKEPISFDLTPTFRVDPNSELGYREI